MDKIAALIMVPTYGLILFLHTKIAVNAALVGISLNALVNDYGYSAFLSMLQCVLDYSQREQDAIKWHCYCTFKIDMHVF